MPSVGSVEIRPAPITIDKPIPRKTPIEYVLSAIANLFFGK